MLLGQYLEVCTEDGRAIMSYIQPYCAIHGYNFSDIVQSDSILPSGGSLRVEELSSPERKYADVRAKGRQPKRYSIVAVSPDRDAIEIFLDEINGAPVDSEFYPFDAERHGLKASSYCSLKQLIDAAGNLLYEGEAVITCREPWLYGPEQGISMVWNGPASVVSETLTNAGQDRAPLNFLQASGDLSLPYVEDLSCRITLGSDTSAHDREIQLCEKMLRGDILTLDRSGEMVHSWEIDFSKTLPQIALDIHGLISGGAISSGVLTLSGDDIFMIPFYGPQPMAEGEGSACIEMDVTAFSGEGAVPIVAFSPVIFDPYDPAAFYPENLNELVIGKNVWNFPDLAGCGFAAIGLMASGSISISSLKAIVKRKATGLPFSDPGESFKIRVESTAGDRLRFVQAFHNDRFYY